MFYSQIYINNYLKKLSFLLYLLLLFSFSVSQNEICFPNHVGLPYDYMPPTIDGYIEPELGLTSSELEKGWTRSNRLTYIGSVGIPQMVFQSLKNNAQDYIYLSFIIHIDSSFDDEDAIVLAFRPSFTTGQNTKTGAERRIDIHPLTNVIGAGIPFDTPDPNDISTPACTLRTNRDPRSVTFYKWDLTASAWDTTSVDCVTVKVRSWEFAPDDRNWSVEIKIPTTTTLGGSNWIDLSSNFGFYFNVIRIWQGSIVDIPVTGLASTQFVWPRANYATGQGLIRDPNPAGGQYLTSISAHEIPNSWWGEANKGSHADCRGVYFYGGHSAIGTRNPSNPSGPLMTKIDTTDNEFVARIINDGTSQADSVYATFRIANWGVGPTNPGTWDKIRSVPGDPERLNPTDYKDIPTGTTPTEFTMKWKLNASEKTAYNNNIYTKHQCVLVQLNSHKEVYFVEGSHWNNMNFQNLSEHVEDADISAQGYPDSSNGSDNEEEFRLYVVKRILSSNENHPGWDGKKVIMKTKSETLSPARNVQVINEGEYYPALIKNIYSQWMERQKEMHTYIWIMNGFNKTQYSLTLEGKTYNIYQPAGAFGYNANHEGDLDSFEDEVTLPDNNLDHERYKDANAKLEKIGDNNYKLTLKNGKVARIRTKIKAIDKFFLKDIFIRLGLTIPHGDAADLYNSGFAGTIGATYQYSTPLFLQLLLGYYTFSGKDQIDNESLIQFALNVKYKLFAQNRFSAFINAGYGGYKFDVANVTKGGMNGGVIVDYDITNQIALEGAFNYYSINTNPSFKFSTIQVGLKYTF